LPDCLGLAFLPHLEAAADLGLEAVVPGRLDQHPPCVFVAASGDRTLATAGAAGVFRRDQAEVGHERPRMRKASEVAYLGNEAHGRHEIDALQTHQRLDQWLHAPALAQIAQRLGEALNALTGLFGGLAILVESDLLGGMLEVDRGQVPLVRLAPGLVPDIIAAQTQEHRLHLLTHPQARCNRIFTGARQIPHRFVTLIRDDDVGQISGAHLASSVLSGLQR